MREKDIDDILKRLPGGGQDVDRALLDRISGSIQSSLAPVKPLPPSWILVVGLILISAAMAIAGGLVLGPHGIQKMDALEIGMIFPVLTALIWLASVLCIAENIPGSRRLMAPWLLVVSGCVALAAVFGVLFHDYRTERFVPQGVACLTAGLIQAIPVSLATWWLLSRGFAVNPLAAGLVNGALAGLAGITMLELHCANFEAPHVIVWHIAVMPISGAIGALVAWKTRARSVPAVRE